MGRKGGGGCAFVLRGGSTWCWSSSVGDWSESGAGGVGRQLLENYSVVSPCSRHLGRVVGDYGGEARAQTSWLGPHGMVHVYTSG